MKKIWEQPKGITLIALVITIIILLILAGTSIFMLTGQSGILSKGEEAKERNKKAEYEEEIYYIITEERAERIEKAKKESFIVSIKSKIDEKDWVLATFMYDKDDKEQTGENVHLNTQLKIETKDGYEIYVDVDNENNLAQIRQNSFQKIGENCTITYDANGGEGVMPATTIKRNTIVNLPQNAFTKAEYDFIGWKDENGVDYKDEDAISIDKNITLYAQWKMRIYTIDYNLNGVTSGTIESHTNCKKGDSITLRENNYTRNGFTFRGWSKMKSTNNESDIIPVGTTIQVEENVTYYAIWELTEGLGQTLKYKEYEFIIYKKDDNGKYLAKPTGTCGTYVSLGGKDVENYISTNFGTEGKVTATLFGWTSDDINTIKSYEIGSNYYIWMIYNNRASPISGDMKSVLSSNSSMEAYIIPKLVIEPSAITKPLNSSYLIIQ